MLKLVDGFYDLQTFDNWQKVKNCDLIKLHPATLNESFDNSKVKIWAVIGKNNKRPYVVENLTRRELKAILTKILTEV